MSCKLQMCNVRCAHGFKVKWLHKFFFCFFLKVLLCWAKQHIQTIGFQTNHHFPWPWEYAIPLTTHTNQNKRIHLDLITNSISRFLNLFLGLDNLVTKFQNVGHWIWSRLSDFPPIHLNRTIQGNIWVTNCNLI